MVQQPDPIPALFEDEPPAAPAEVAKPQVAPLVRPDDEDDDGWITSEPEQWTEHTWGSTKANVQAAPDSFTITASEDDYIDDDVKDQQPNLLDDLAAGLNPKKGGRAKPSRKEKASEAQPKKSLFDFSKKDETPSKKAVKVGGASIGLRIFRVVLISFLVLAMFNGIRYMLAPPKPVSLSALTTAVTNELGVTTFPAGAAGALAAQFTEVYLNFRPEQETAREDALKALAPSVNVDEYAANFATFQYVTSGPFVTRTLTQDDGRAVVTVAATVAPTPDEFGRWVYLDIAVAADSSGRLAITGPPAITPTPIEPPTEPVARAFAVDSNAEATLTQILPEFYSAWAASNASALSQYIAPNATTSASQGLQGTVKLQSLDSLTIPTVESQPEITPIPEGVPASSVVRQAWTGVTWVDDLGNTYKQAYRLILLQDENTQKWLVQDVQGGIALAQVIPEGTTTPTDAASPSPSAAP